MTSLSEWSETSRRTRDSVCSAFSALRCAPPHYVYYTVCTHIHCTHYIQDAQRKRFSDSPSGEVAEILEESYLSLVEHTHANEPQVSLQYLQSVASMRFGLSVAAEQLRNGRVDDPLLRVTHDLCVDHRVNVIDPTGRVDTTGPVLYLLKLLIRQFGYPCLKAVCEAHPWVVPEELRRGDEVRGGVRSIVLHAVAMCCEVYFEGIVHLRCFSDPLLDRHGSHLLEE